MHTHSFAQRRRLSRTRAIPPAPAPPPSPLAQRLHQFRSRIFIENIIAFGPMLRVAFHSEMISPIDISLNATDNDACLDAPPFGTLTNQRL